MTTTVRCLPHLIAGLVIALIVSCLILPLVKGEDAVPDKDVATQKAPRIDPAVLQTIADFIDDLGDSEYAIREDAEAQLLKHGKNGLDLLNKAAKSRDLEIRFRATRILETINFQLYSNHLDQFEKGETESLPHWKEFQEKVGATDAHRKLFVSMHRAEPKLMQILPSRGRELNQLFHFRMSELLSGGQAQVWGVVRSTRRNKLEFTGTEAALFYLSTCEDISVNQSFAYQISRPIGYFQTPEGKKRLASNSALKDLMNHWIVNCETVRLDQRLSSAAMVQLNAGGILLARKTIQTGTPQTHIAMSILILAKLGDKEAIPELVSLLENKTDISYRRPAKMNGGVTTQVRDIALMGLLQITKQLKNSYGYSSRGKVNSSTAISLHSARYIGFTSQKARDAAFKKWDEWWGKNGSKYSDKTDPVTTKKNRQK